MINWEWYNLYLPTLYILCNKQFHPGDFLIVFKYKKLCFSDSVMQLSESECSSKRKVISRKNIPDSKLFVIRNVTSDPLRAESEDEGLEESIPELLENNVDMVEDIDTEAKDEIQVFRPFKSHLPYIRFLFNHPQTILYNHPFTSPPQMPFTQFHSFYPMSPFRKIISCYPNCPILKVKNYYH